MPIPVLEFFYLIMKLKDNRPFLAISRFFCISLIALAAIGCADQWVIPLDEDSMPCVKGKFECYQGPPLSLPEFVADLKASEMLFLLPIIYVFAAFMLSFQPPRTYLILFVLAITALVIDVGSDPEPYLYYLSGAGKWLHTLGVSFIIILSIPLSINEQITFHPNYDYQGIFKYFPG
jgi:hypothetical protein